MYLQVVRHVTKCPRYRDLQEQTNCSHGITAKRRETKAPNERWRVCVKATLWTVVAERDAKMEPHTPARELWEMSLELQDHEYARNISNVELLQHTAFLNAGRPMRFFFLPFIGSSSRTRVRRIWTSLSLNTLTQGRNVLCGSLNEFGKQKPKIKPQSIVKAPIRAKSQNQPGLPPTPRMWRIPNARSFDEAWPNWFPK